jgi:hypothetical protein
MRPRVTSAPYQESVRILPSRNLPASAGTPERLLGQTLGTRRTTIPFRLSDARQNIDIGQAQS